MPFVGIDLGTTNSCVAVLQNQGVEVIADENSNRLTPSCVAFVEDEKFVGNKNLMEFVPENTVFGIKRVIGRRFADSSVQANIQNWPFEVYDDGGIPKIRVTYHKKKHEFLPEQISMMVLQKLKQVAERFTGTEINNAVVTVPAYFNDAPRAATRDAVKLAGLNLVRLLNEPTAAAIAYCYQEKLNSGEKLLVYDLGGGTFDVSLLTVDGINFSVKAVGGDTHLGGDDFDQKMVEHAMTVLEDEHGIRTFTSSDKANLRVKCEKAKRNFSVNTIERIYAHVGGKAVNFKMSRATFDELNREYFHKTLDLVKDVLNDAGVKKEEVMYVILVGGSTRIVYVQTMLSEFFGSHKIKNDINPDEIVARGAAIYAAHKSGIAIPNIAGICLHDVTPLNIGINVKGGLMSVIVPRNSTIPVKKVGYYETAGDYQTSSCINIYEGLRAKLVDNHKLGGFQLEDLPVRPRGEVKYKVTIEIDDDGTMHARAHENTKDIHGSTALKFNSSRLTESEIARLLRDADQNLAEDEKFRERVAASNELESLISKLQRISTSVVVHRKCKEIETWMKKNEDASKEESVQKRGELEDCNANYS